MQIGDAVVHGDRSRFLELLIGPATSADADRPYTATSGSLDVPPRIAYEDRVLRLHARLLQRHRDEIGRRFAGIDIVASGDCVG